jgi:uncharacterized protein
VSVIQPLTGVTLIAVATLLLAVLTLLVRPLAVAMATVCAVVAGHVAGILHGPAALSLLALALSTSLFRVSRGWLRVLWMGVTIALSLLLGLHLLPWFTNPVVVREAIVSSGARPYSQYVNFDKTLGAVLLLACAGFAPIRSGAEWRAALRLAAPVTLATAIVVMTASLALGFVRFEPRWTWLFLVWAPINLLLTCVSEEAFFRGFVQTELHRTLTGRHADAIAVVVSAILFGLAHAAGGWRYVLLASLAGGGYAFVYQQTRRLEMAILAHFTVNAVHFLLFTYPALALV